MKMNKVLIGMTLLLLSLMLESCNGTYTTTVATTAVQINDCHYDFQYYAGEAIPISNIVIDNANVLGNLENFINVCKDNSENPIVLTGNKLKSYTIEFLFDNIYPLKDVEITNFLANQADSLKTINIDVSSNGVSYDRIKNNVVLSNDNNMDNILDLNGISAKSVKITFMGDKGVGNYGGDEFGLNDVRFHLGSGLIVQDATDWDSAFLRYDGWTGADGIFSFNLTNGDDYVGAQANTTGFIFSDTFVGSVYPNNDLRHNYKMINNSLGYYDGNQDISQGMSFDYKTGLNDVPQSVFTPDKLVGYTANNLINGYGLNVYDSKEALLDNEAPGIMWLSQTFNNEEVNFDLEKSVDLGNIDLWNYNEDVLKGVKDFELDTSLDGVNWTSVDTYTLDKASGNINEPYNKEIDLTGITARYLKLKILSSYEDNPSQVGLGKVMIFDDNNNYMFAKVTASSTDPTLVGNELTARLWLQDGVVIGNYFYDFPITVKDDDSAFKIYDVSMIKVPIVNERLDYDHAKYLDTPLQSSTNDGGTIYYGAGVMNMSASGGYPDSDGYVYIYGYKDLNGDRSLTVARTKPENIANFNDWEYYNGSGWSSEINDSIGIKSGVSAELSVTYMSDGMFKGKYMLVVMENTLSGKVSYALSDTPYGPFSDYKLLYQTTEASQFTSAYTYNAKMHPSLSEPGNYLISYNVNSFSSSALTNVNVYHPRFIRVIEVKNR